MLFRSEELGGSRIVQTDVDGLPFAATITEGHDGLQPGDKIGILVPRQAIHLFEAETGRRLALPAAAATLSAVG